MGNFEELTGTLVAAPANPFKSGYGFVKLDVGGDNLYVIRTAIQAAGLCMDDVGCRVKVRRGYAAQSMEDRYVGYHIERLDDTIGGEELDPIEAEMFKRLAKMERWFARLDRQLAKLKKDAPSQEDLAEESD